MSENRQTDLGVHDAVGIRADNPGPLTLSGTNSWVVGRQLAWVIDPGPADPTHIERVVEEVKQRGGLGGIALTHSHSDHSEGIDMLVELAGEVPVIGAEPHGSGIPAHGSIYGPLETHSLPGHSADHVAYIAGGVAFTGDALFAQSSVFVSPGSGSLTGYLDSLQLLAARSPAVIAPGHGPLIENPTERINQQVAHRLERERRLVDALGVGHREIDALLGEVWDDVPDELIPAAAVTLAAHLDRLEETGRLPEGVERPDLPGWVV